MTSPPPLTFSTDAKHRETLGVLQEAIDYLGRLPMHPQTTAMIRKLQAHLDAPASRLLASESDTHTGETFSVAGLPLLRARLKGQELEVGMRDVGAHKPQQEREVMELLRKGARIGLTNIGAETGAWN